MPKARPARTWPPIPKGKKYRNLTRGPSGTVYYCRKINGQRTRFSLETKDPDLAVRRRDVYERDRGLDADAELRRTAGRLTFSQMAADFLRCDHFSGLAPSTQAGYRGRLDPVGGVLIRALGSFEVRAITRKVLDEHLWQPHVVRPGRARATGLSYLNITSDVLGLAQDRDYIETNPVDAFRRTLRRRNRGKQARHEADRRDTRHPIERIEDLAAFVEASEAIASDNERRWRRGDGRRQPLQGGRAGHVATLLMLDAGLRMGEVGGLRWGHVTFGESPADPRRFLHIQESVAAGRWETTTKSGRRRRVDLSRRLRRLLRDWWLSQGQPGPQERVLPPFNPGNFRARYFTRVCEATGLSGYKPKDLRDTFASHLFSVGVDLPYIQEMLGHAEVTTTVRNYAKWIEEARYRPRVEVDVAGGELPVDLIERIVSKTDNPRRRAVDTRG